MRCPKCHYLSFDPEPRCRNCGYDLEVADADLALKTAEPVDAPLPDLPLREPPPASMTPLPLEIVRPAPDAPGQETERRPPFRAPHTTAELPLFVKGIADHHGDADEGGFGRDEPPALPPARPPLAVRRAASTPQRLGPLDRDFLEDLKRVEREETVRTRDEARELGFAVEPFDDPVRPMRRAGAAAVDVAMLGGIAAFVFWATLQVCAINLSDLGAAALVPLVVFIVVMDITYLLMFTAAGGQTIGKMLMGIRVVGDEAADGGPVPVRQAAWRAALTVIALGLGWLPALFGQGLALHDRFAHTRVVRA